MIKKIDKRKTRLIIIVISIIIISILLKFWTIDRADYYADLSHNAQDTQEKILNLEKSLALKSNSENIVELTNLYVSIGRIDLAEKIMIGKENIDVLNRLGALYLNENKTNEAEESFEKASNIEENAESYKGLMFVSLKKADREEANNYFVKLMDKDSSSSNYCYASFMQLNNFNTAKDSYTKANKCKLYELDKYFLEHNENQSSHYLKLEAANLYYQNQYYSLAILDIMALLKDNNDYRDAYVLAFNIYEKIGDNEKAEEYRKKALELDPLAFN